MKLGNITIDIVRRWALRRHVAVDGCYYVCGMYHVGPLVITRWAS